MQILLALAIYSFGLFNGALCVAFFQGAGRALHSDARDLSGRIQGASGSNAADGSSSGRRHTQGYGQAFIKR
jgi:hypothetical protein